MWFETFLEHRPHDGISELRVLNADREFLILMRMKNGSFLNIYRGRCAMLTYLMHWILVNTIAISLLDHLCSEFPIKYEYFRKC